MAFMNMSLLFAAVVAVCAQNNLVDEVSLLQEKVETKRRSTKVDTPDDISAEDYSYAADVKCTHDEKAAVEATPSVQLAASTEISTADTQSEDPAGAASLRLFFLSMTVLIVLDGIWRSLQLRQEKPSKPISNHSSHAQQEPKDEAALESAWVAVVNAARNADEASFKKALTSQVPLLREDAWGCTALHFAAVGGSVPIATELLNHGVQVDALDAGDETALHIAARAGHVSMCELFIGAGANIDTVSKAGLTPLAAAGFANQDQTCRLLTKSGAGVAGLSDAELPTVIVKHIVEQCMAA